MRIILATLLLAAIAAANTLPYGGVTTSRHGFVQSMGSWINPAGGRTAYYDEATGRYISVEESEPVPGVVQKYTVKWRFAQGWYFRDVELFTDWNKNGVKDAGEVTTSTSTGQYA